MNFKSKLTTISENNKNTVAVTDLFYQKSYTFEDLLSYAKGFQTLNIKNKKIGIFIDKSADFVAAVYALTLSDCSFVPLDPSLPIERLNFIINDSGIKDILTVNRFKDNAVIESLNVHVLTQSNDDLIINYDDNNLMYTIYTSGTTGVPKGVEVNFKGIDNVISQQIEIFELDYSNIYWFLSMNFDASLSDIYCSLLSASTFFIDERVKYEVSSFIEFINDYLITYVDIPPSFIKLINPIDVPSLKSIVIGGEVADPETVRKYSACMKVINVYGPTEATICTSYSICDNNWSRPLIGQALDGVHYIILDENQLEVSNIAGELYISGVQLARGYTNPKLTQERFIEINGSVWYKTGDKVIKTDMGIEFIGRIDRQIKHNGQLICLEEIEQAINAIEAVSNVSVVYKDNKIHAYYEGDVDKKDIVNFISKMLPQYMIPHYFLHTSIPKTANGKNDSKHLTNDNLFKLISSIFTSILGHEIVEDISFRDNGADSMKFILLQKELQNIGMNISFDYLMDKNTIEDIISYVHVKPITKYELVNSIDWSLIKISQDLDFHDTNVALMTGVTGHLGSAILHQIKDAYKTIYCLIRAVSYEDAISKFMKKNTLQDNIVILPITSLSDDLIGLSKKDYEMIKDNVSHIYHNAANVNNIGTFDQLFNDNVKSSANIIQFSFDGILKKIYYSSTLSVHVSGSHLNNSIIDEDTLMIDSEELYNGYAQTKWLSDYMMSYYNKHNHIQQFRLGLLLPEQLSSDDKNSFLYQFIDESLKSSTLPTDSIGLSFDFTPINWAAKIIADVSFDSNEYHHIYNVSANKKVYYNDIVLSFNKDLVESEKWFNNHNNYLSILLNMLNGFKYPNVNLFEMTYIDYFVVKNIQNYIPYDFNVDDIIRNYVSYFENKVV